MTTSKSKLPIKFKLPRGHSAQVEEVVNAAITLAKAHKGNFSNGEVQIRHIGDNLTISKCTDDLVLRVHLRARTFEIDGIDAYGRSITRDAEEHTAKTGNGSAKRLMRKETTRIGRRAVLQTTTLG